MGEGDQKVQASSYKILRPEDKMYSSVTIVNKRCIAYLKVAKRPDLKVLITRKKLIPLHGDAC